MLQAVCCTCFFDFFRSEEITTSTSHYDPSIHLSIQDITLDSRYHPSLVQFNLNSSKTDSFRKGVQVVIGYTGDDLCPVTAILAYLAARGGSEGPLFRTGDKQPLTRHQFVNEVKTALKSIGLDPSKYAGHSFRAGAATAAARLEDCTIKTLGRWESSAN